MMNALRRKKMYERRARMETAKGFIKELVKAGNTVKEIKDSLREHGYPVTAYDYFKDHGFIDQWRSQNGNTN